MSPAQSSARVELYRFPRVSGDEPAHDLDVDGLGRFSPREWG